jgi:type II secretory pathway component GspD/PulD (secretin)
MITTKVKATISKRGADVSLSAGNPPPTYEKIITTEVRSKSGETVILSGLIQDDSVLIEQRIPLVSKIPIIGKLFSSLINTREKTEMLIYLIPKLVNDDEENKLEIRDKYQERMDDITKNIFHFLKEECGYEF